MKHFSFRLAVVKVCPVLLPSELLLSTHLPTSEGWTAELTVGLWLVVPTIILMIMIILIQIFTEEGLSHSKVLFVRVLYLTNCIDSLKTL